MTTQLIVATIIIIALAVTVGTIARMYRKVGPNEALIVFGIGGTRVVVGNGALVIPVFQECRGLSLELMSFDVAPQKELYTHQGVSVLIDAVTQIKIKNDLENVRTAADQFLDKTPEQRESAIRLVMEGHLRGIVGQLTVEEIVKEPEMVGDKVRSTCAGDLAKMGLDMISFTIKEVWDQNEYIKNMGLPDIERVKMEANIATAHAQRDTEFSRANALREAAVSKAMADQERVIAQTASMTKQAEAQRDLEVKQAEYQETVQKQKATADKAYELQTSVMQQQVIAEQVKVEQVERMGQVQVQEAEILRREKELIATEIEPAETEAKRRLTLASAEKDKEILEAQGNAEAVRRNGEAEADVLRMRGEAEVQILRLRGEAEAQVIKAKGEAEAAAMDVKAQAFQGYNEAAVLDKLISSLPEIVRALAEPLSRVDKITVVSTGDNATAGVNKVTADVAKMVAQVPTLVESLSGISLVDLIRALPRMGEDGKQAEFVRSVPEAPKTEVEAV